MQRLSSMAGNFCNLPKSGNPSRRFWGKSRNKAARDDTPCSLGKCNWPDGRRAVSGAIAEPTIPMTVR